MQDPNSNQQNADSSSDDAFASPDGPQQIDKTSQTYNLDTGKVEALNRDGGAHEDDDAVSDMSLGIGSDGGSAGDGGGG